MSFHLDNVHGVDLDRLCAIVADALPFELTRPKLNPSPLGGWSNVNLLMSADGCEMVVRLPGRKDAMGDGSYAALFAAYEILGRQGIAPNPLGLGWLDSDERIPFIVLEFVTGKVRSALSQMTSSEMHALSQVLSRMSRIRIPELVCFSSVSEYSQWLCDRVHSLDDRLGETNCRVMQVIREYDSIEASFGESLASRCPWSGSNMHGDLQESNVLFTERGVMLLDLEYCSVGEPLLDLAYLFCQAESGITCDYPRELVPSEKLRKQIDVLMPLALMTVVSWSIQRLALIELNLLEASLMHAATAESVTHYARSKMAALESVKRRLRW